MTSLSIRSILVVAASLILSTACGSGTGASRQVPVGGAGQTPTGPSTSGPISLSTPQAVSPTNGEQLSTLRPTLTVQNATSSQQSGARTYEFQVSDRTDFSLGASLGASFIVSVNQAGVPEGSDGRTSFTVPSDLQPTTRMYWRARVVQGTSASNWSDPAMFRTKLVGYNRAGELYDPLIHFESIGQITGAHTFIAGRGLRLETEESYVQYQLGEPISTGEMSVEVEGLRPNGPDHKLKIFSMNDTAGDISFSNMQMSAMYRGIDGNPPNCISFKAVFGSQSRILEPNRDQRNAAIIALDPARTYFWKATWSGEFRLMVNDGGENGNTIYNLGFTSPGGSFRPAYAWLGTTSSRFGTDAGTFPGAIYRHLWIGNRPRPATLGNALD